MEPVLISSPTHGVFFQPVTVANGVRMSANSADQDLNNMMTVVPTSTPKLLPRKDESIFLAHPQDAQFVLNDNMHLGPVEKAVLQQAMYNQSKKQAPAMRRCDECNVIFNSQMQAEMHYKGKKHARIMYLKRTKEIKTNSSKPNDYQHDVDNNEESDTQMPQLSCEDMARRQDALATPLVPIPSSFSSASSHKTLALPCRIKYNNIKSVSPGTKDSDTVRQHPYQRVRLTSTEQQQNTVHDNIAQKNTDEIKELSVQSQTATIQASHSNSSEISQVLSQKASESSAVLSSEENDEDQDSKHSVLPSKLGEEKSELLEQSQDDKKEEILAPLQREPVILPDPLPIYIKKVERPAVLKESLRCSVCDIYVNSENQMKQHVSSLRHKNIEQGIPTPPKPGKDDKPKTRAEQFRCEVCRVTLNSDIQLLQHLSSQRHKNMLEGKPPKPRWTPYERTQQAIIRSAAQLRLPFSALPNANPSILVSPSINGSIPLPSLPVVAQPALRTSVLPSGAPAAHLKQTAFLAANGSLFQTREIVYVGTTSPGFPGAYPQQRIATLPQQPLHLQHHHEMSPLFKPPAVGVEQLNGIGM